MGTDTKGRVTPTGIGILGILLAVASLLALAPAASAATAPGTAATENGVTAYTSGSSVNNYLFIWFDGSGIHFQEIGTHIDPPGTPPPGNTCGPPPAPGFPPPTCETPPAITAGTGCEYRSVATIPYVFEGPNAPPDGSLRPPPGNGQHVVCALGGELRVDLGDDSGIQTGPGIVNRQEDWMFVFGTTTVSGPERCPEPTGCSPIPVPTLAIGGPGDDLIDFPPDMTAAVTIQGDDGADLLAGSGGGANTMSGGAGDDVLAATGPDAESSERDSVSCGEGIDRAAADPTDFVAADCEQIASAEECPGSATECTGQITLTQATSSSSRAEHRRRGAATRKPGGKKPPSLGKKSFSLQPGNTNGIDEADFPAAQLSRKGQALLEQKGKLKILQTVTRTIDYGSKTKRSVTKTVITLREQDSG